LPKWADVLSLEGGQIGDGYVVWYIYILYYVTHIQIYTYILLYYDIPVSNQETKNPQRSPTWCWGLVECGSRHTLCLTFDGLVVGFGSNSEGGADGVMFR
jgi:hypothetical protein